MLILKYSFLDEENGVVKTICMDSGKYGMYHLASETEIIKPKYDFIYAFDGDKAVVKNDGYCFQIDRSGKEFYDLYKSIEEYEGEIEIIDKGDVCPNCKEIGSGCETCMGHGCIFPNGDFCID